jgi:hypothetical protein
MNLLWGTVPFLVDADEFKHPQNLARRLAKERNLAEQGDYILLVAGMRADEADSVPMVTVIRM